MADLPIACTLTPETIRTRRAGLLPRLLERADSHSRVSRCVNHRSVKAMSLSTTLGILFLAALLEAGGDALVRSGLGASALPIRWACFAAGALVLFSYGYVVNTPTWDFGRLLGS